MSIPFYPSEANKIVSIYLLAIDKSTVICLSTIDILPTCIIQRNRYAKPSLSSVWKWLLSQPQSTPYPLPNWSLLLPLMIQTYFASPVVGTKGALKNHRNTGGTSREEIGSGLRIHHNLYLFASLHQ